MTKSIDELIAEADGLAFSALKDAAQATVTKADGTTVAADVIIDPEQAELGYETDGQGRRFSRQASFLTSAVGTLAIRDKVTWGGVDYTIERVAAADHSMVTVDLTRQTAVARHEQNRVRE